VSWDVIWQPGHVGEEGVTATADGLGDGRETIDRSECIIVDKLVPFFDCLLTVKPTISVNSAFHPSGVGKSSTGGVCSLMSGGR